MSPDERADKVFQELLALHDYSGSPAWKAVIARAIREAEAQAAENVGRDERWVLVPKEATAPMIVAGVAAWKANAFASISGVWEAMLSNAPKCGVSCGADCDE